MKALMAEGLIERAGRERWEVTQAGRTLAAATAAKRVTRATAEDALQQFLDRVERVNQDPYFLGRVTKVVLFGSMLKAEIDRLSDVDLAGRDASASAARAASFRRSRTLPCQRALVRQRYRNVAPGLPVFRPSVRMARGHIGSPTAEC